MFRNGCWRNTEVWQRRKQRRGVEYEMCGLWFRMPFFRLHVGMLKVYIVVGKVFETGPLAVPGVAES